MMSRVLIVDDNENNRIVLRDALEDEDYVLREACDGAEALELIEQEPPDAVLLDVMMPVMDGVECCKRLKADPAAASIPVLMITALDQDDAIVRGLDAGATDYISKPFSGPVVRARLRSVLRAKRQLDQLVHRNSEILQLAYAMTHDLQTPLASLTGAADALRRRLNGQTDEKTGKWLGRIESSATRMVGMLDDLMAYARAGTEQLDADLVDLTDTLGVAIDQHQEQASGKGVQVTLKADRLFVRADAKALLRVVSNLIGNAIKYIDATDTGRVEVHATAIDGVARLTVRDNGPGIPTSQLDRVFLPFKRATSAQRGTGLGLAIVKKYVDAFGGRVWLESDGKSGTTAVLELRQADPASGAVGGSKAA